MTRLQKEKQKLPKISKVRNDLPEKVKTAESAPGRLVRSVLIILLLPFVLFWVWEAGSRIVDPPERTLPKPWVKYHSPYPPLTEFHWTGDLRRMARLPRYDLEVESSPAERRFSHRMVDERGYVNLPGENPDELIGQRHDIIVTGSSYMAEGSTMEKTFPAQLEKRLGQPVYNAAWPGGPPTLGIRRLLTDDSFFQGNADIVFFGIIQRLMYDWNFRPLIDAIDEQGNVIEPYQYDQPDPDWRDYLEWRKSLENYLERTSVVRKWSAWAGRFLPPMAFDKGYDAPVRIAWLKRNNMPILFFPGDIASTYHSFEDRGGETIIEAIRRANARCKQLGIRMIVLFVPDKYEVYRSEVEPKLYPSRHPDPDNPPQHPDQRAPEVATEHLHELGIEAIDFYPALYDAQFNNGLDKLVYWVDDTHWSDTGIEVAADRTVEYLNENPQDGR